MLHLLLAVSALAQSPDVVLATTTSTRDAGLLDSILPVFEAKSHLHVKVLAVGTGQAIEIARRGDADVVLVHAPELERALVDSGFFVHRRLVMHDDFLLVGPASDPAKLAGGHDAVAAMRAIAAARAPFVSRGDRSGTQILELKLWRLAGVTPPPPGGWGGGAGTSRRGRAWPRRCRWPIKSAPTQSRTDPRSSPGDPSSSSCRWSRATRCFTTSIM